MSSSTPRDIAVFIDGTWNRHGTGGSTNVRKLYEATQTGPINGREQVKFYVTGVGTKPMGHGEGLDDAEYSAYRALLLGQEMPTGMGPARRFIGGAFGKGTTARIKAAYQTICEEFDRFRGDRVFVFGFSRGAFAARSLAGFMEKVGLLLRGRWRDVPRAYELYELGRDPAQSELAEHLFKLTGSRIYGVDSEFWLPLHFLGVWDTVASLGLPSRLNWLSAPFTEYHQVDVPPNVMHARHGLALHELRGAFEPLLWQPGGHSSLKQVWFPGAHADVGGGYRAGEAGLSDNALMWMAAEAESKGLVLDRSHKWLNPPGHPANVHHEIRGLFLATLPTVRRWLEAPNLEEVDTHYFHATMRDHLFASPGPAYKFLHPFVNSALRRADELAAPKMLTSILRGNQVVP